MFRPDQVFDSYGTVFVFVLPLDFCFFPDFVLLELTLELTLDLDLVLIVFVLVFWWLLLLLLLLLWLSLWRVAVAVAGRMMVVSRSFDWC